MQLEANNEEIAASIAEGGNSRAKRESLRYEVGVLICMALPNMDNLVIVVVKHYLGVDYYLLDWILETNFRHCLMMIHLF